MFRALQKECLCGKPHVRYYRCAELYRCDTCLRCYEIDWSAKRARQILEPMALMHRTLTKRLYKTSDAARNEFLRTTTYPISFDALVGALNYLYTIEQEEHKCLK